MKYKIVLALAALLLAFPAVSAQGATEQLGMQNVFPVPTGAATTTTDPIAMLGNLADLFITRAPAAVSQIANLCINVVMVFVAFVQLGIQLLLYPSGLPLLANLFLMGLVDAFNFAITGGIYGGMLGLPVCLVGAVVTAPLGALVGGVFGFFYGLFNGANAKLPAELQNPYLDSWKTLIP